MPEPGPTIFAAGLVLPVSAPAIREGAVLVRDGRIAAVGGLEDLGQQNADAELRYYPHYTIVPGAVNTHAHLGFRRGDAPEGGSFSKWLAGLIERLPEKEKWTAEAARASARESIEAGTTFMAESSPYGECLPQLAGSRRGGRGSSAGESRSTSPRVPKRWSSSGKGPAASPTSSAATTGVAWESHP